MQNSASLFDQFFVRKLEKQIPLTIEVLITVLGSLALAVSAQVSFHFSMSPVPFTLQTLILFMLALTLGTKRSVAMTALYLLEGLSGLPVFAGGSFGLVALLGPSGGFLMAFPLVAWVTSKIYGLNMNSKVVKAVVATTTGYLVLFLMGAGWLSLMIGMTKAIQLAVVPFLPIEALKLIVISGLVPFINKKI